MFVFLLVFYILNESFFLVYFCCFVKFFFVVNYFNFVGLYKCVFFKVEVEEKLGFEVIDSIVIIYE